MKFAIYHREREWAREMGDPKLAEIEAPSKEEAERLTAHLGSTGTIAVLLASGSRRACRFPIAYKLSNITATSEHPIPAF